MDYGMDYQGGGGGGFNNSGGGRGRGGGGGGGRPSSGYSSQSGDRGGGGGGARKSYDEQTMIPITISMALASRPDESAEGSGNQQLADGRKLYHVRIVAATRTVEDHSTNALYTVEDGTGLIEVKQWEVDDACSAVEEAKRESLKDGIYLKITGQIKDYDGKKMIVADSIRPLSTGNELAHHMLEVVYTEQMAQRKNSFATGGGAHNNNNNMMMGGTGVGFGGMETPSHHHQHRRAQQPLQQSAGGGGGGGDGGLRDKVLDFIKARGEVSDEGGNITECVQDLQLNSGYSEASVRKMVDELSSEGLIYSTVDEDHYMFAS